MVVNSKFKIPNTRELFTGLKNARGEWKLKTPLQKWCYFFGIGRAAYGLGYIPLMVDVNNVHWLRYSAFVYAGIIIALSSYTISYYAYQGDLQMALPSTCMPFIFIGVCKRNIIAFNFNRNCSTIHSAIIEYYKTVYAQKFSFRIYHWLR